MPAALLALLSVLLPPVDAEAVFVDHAPAVARTFTRIESGTVDQARALRLLQTLRDEQGRRLTPASTADDDLFIQVDQAIEAFIDANPQFAEARRPSAADPIRAARAAAAAGATQSARRWLDQAPANGPLAAQLDMMPLEQTARTPLHVGDAVPADLVDAPMWRIDRAGPDSMPLFTGDAIVLTGPDRIECFDILSGEQLWRRDSLTADFTGGTSTHGSTLAANTVPGGDVIVWTGQPTATGHVGTAKIMRLASSDGSIRWTFDTATLDDATGALRPSGPPLVGDGAVFIPMRRHGRAMQVESWLLALDLERGTQRWLRWLGSAGASVRGVIWPGDALTLDNLRLYVQTGTGVLGAVDTRFGDIDWLRRMTPGRWRARSGEAPHHWAIFRPLRSGSRLVTLAPDLSALLVIDPASGVLVGSHTAVEGTPLEAVHSLQRTADGDPVTHGQSITRWSLEADDTLTPVWTWVDATEEPHTGRLHVTPAEVLVPLGDRIVALHLDDGRPLHALPSPGGGHPCSAGGLVAIASHDALTAMGGLSSTLSRLQTRIRNHPQHVHAHLGVIDLAVRARQPALIRTHLPGAMSIGAKEAPAQATDAAVAALQLLDPEQPGDMALADAAIDVLSGSPADQARLHLARGDWIEPASADAAIESWLAAGAESSTGAWGFEGGVHAPIAALVARRMARLGLDHAINWPPESDHPGTSLRAARARDAQTRPHALALIASADGMEAIAIARVAAFDDRRVESMRNVVSPALDTAGSPRRIPGGALQVPRNEGLLLRNGATLTWHESPLTPAVWSVTVDGAAGEVVSIDEDQIVLSVDELTGGRRLESLGRADGSARWSLKLDQFASEIDPPVVIAATGDVAALAGREQVHLIDLREGSRIQPSPSGAPVDAVTSQGKLVLLLDDTPQRRSVLNVVDGSGRTTVWPHPPLMPRSTWIDRGPLGGIVLGDDQMIAFAPGAGEQWWWVARHEGPAPLRGALVLPDAIITRGSTSLLERRDPLTGALLGPVDTPSDRSDAVVTGVEHLGDGMLVVTDAGVIRLDARGDLVWADAHEESTAPVLATVAGSETIVLHEKDVLQDTLLPMEDRSMHRLRRLDRHGRLVDTIDLFPMAGRIRRAGAVGGMLLLSDDLDTWLVPIPATEEQSPV